MKRVLLSSLLCCVLLAGCGLGQVAQIMKTYRIALGAYQDTETAAFQKGFESVAMHQKAQHDVEILANAGIVADKAIIASDKTTALGAMTNALTAINDIETNDVTGIGDATTRGAVEVAVAGIKNILTQVYNGLGGR